MSGFRRPGGEVHAGDAEHGVVEVEAVEEGAVEVIAALFVEEEFRMAFAEVFTGGDEEAGGAGGRIIGALLH